MAENVFDGTLDAFDAYMKETGFVRRDPVEEPECPETLEGVQTGEVKDHYARWIAYYLFIADEVALNEGLREVMKLQAKTAAAQAYIDACKMAKVYTNDSARRAAADCDPINVCVQAELARVVASYRALEGRRKSASKTMDWLGRELYNRTGRMHHQDSGSNKSGRPWGGHRLPQNERPAEAAPPRRSAGVGNTPSMRKAPRARKQRRPPTKRYDD